MDKPYVVGMDIGGTNSVFGIVDARGNILSVDSVKTQEYKEIDEYVNAVAEKLIPMIDAVGGVAKIKGMGIGAPMATITPVLSSLPPTSLGRV